MVGPPSNMVRNYKIDEHDYKEHLVDILID